MSEDEKFMRLALAEADASILPGGLPFAAIAVSQVDGVLATDHDRVKENCDPTAHAEINVIRALCRARQTTKLADITIYTTSEPCPTCLSVMIKARIPRVVFGARTEVTASLPIPAAELAERTTNHKIEVIGEILAEECLKQREDYFQQVR